MGLLGCPNKSTQSATPKAPYATLVSTFTIGVIALETGDPQHDRTYLTKFTQLAPEEPAGWANLGLLELRSNHLPEAAADLARAQAMASQNAVIETMLALLADRQGDLAGAIRHYQQAVQIAPDNLRARYALAEQLERQNTPEGDTAYQEQLQGILDRQPYNLVAQLRLARIAAKRGDAPALRKIVGLLEARSTTFAPGALRYFNQLKTASAGAEVRSAAITAQLLGNTLQTNISYAPSVLALEKNSQDGIGDPVKQFLKLPPMAATPAPPDTGLNFAASPLIPGAARAARAGAFRLDGTGTLALFSADGRMVHLSTGVNLAFPGGAQATPPGPHGILALDTNYDLRNDLAFAGAGGFRLYTQDKSGAFTEVTSKTKLPAAILGGAYQGAWAMDIEADGDIDIVLGTLKGDPLVLRNNGDGTWLPIHPFAHCDGVRDFVAADVEGSGNPDVAMIDRQSRLHVFTNERGGLFHERSLPAKLGPVAAVAAADLNDDGLVDFLVLQTDGTLLRLSDKAQGTDWETAEVAHWPAPPKDLAAGTATLLLGDLDNNGGLDVVASTPTQSEIWLCDDKNGYAPLVSLPHAVSALADVDKDGRLDLIGVSPAGQADRLVNSGKLNYHWQEVRPRAADAEFDKEKFGDRRINSFGIGGEIEARAGLMYQKQMIDSPVVHFGLGNYPSLDALRTLWPNGDVRGEFADTLKPDQTVVLPHRLKGSCPFLFAWNGTRMQFVTDCIWRSPLGLKINAQDTAGVAQTEDWVKIRGDQLVPDAQGNYSLSVTAELWETHFFDHLSLLTVDHPANTDIFVDERFAIPPPPHQVYLTTPPQPIARAVDDNGTDVTEILRARDGKHLDTFGRGDYQGVTRDHWVEIDLGDTAPHTGPLWLICYGWIHPTDSSINVALGQGHGAPPQGLTLETPDSQGHWSVAKRGLGFPEGKVKTILIDLDGVFKPGAPHRLRLRTNLEIYWDAIQWATGLPTQGLQIQHLSLAAAELRYRGFSAIHAADASSPELPDSYEKLQSEIPQWRDLAGFYTRYGDVRALLTKIDDRYVIMNAGDELRLRFAAPPAPPAGLVRDYVLIGDGWVKDGDYNTTFSRTVLPLPAHDRPNYTTPPGRLEDDPVYRHHPRDWVDYHTRYVTPDAFGRRLSPGN